MYSQNMIILVAMTADRIIGRQGELPWDILKIWRCSGD